jgi:ABC-type transporter Mla subunit MlaD
MALQDLTPRLRTRLGRIERVVALFVGFAVLALLTGLSFYIYKTSERRGWFLRKVPYFTFVKNASGLKVGDPVKLMGFNAGTITEIEPQPADD